MPFHDVADMSASPGEKPNLQALERIRPRLLIQLGRIERGSIKQPGLPVSRRAWLLSINPFKCLCSIGRAGFEPARGYPPADFKFSKRGNMAIYNIVVLISINGPRYNRFISPFLGLVLSSPLDFKNGPHAQKIRRTNVLGLRTKRPASHLLHPMIGLVPKKGALSRAVCRTTED